MCMTQRQQLINLDTKFSLNETMYFDHDLDNILHEEFDPVLDQVFDQLLLI